jgi:hypothetical protein
MQAEIDRAAGIIWRYLNEHGEMTLSKLKQGTRLADPPLLMGIGWLAREVPSPPPSGRSRRRK